MMEFLVIVFFNTKHLSQFRIMCEKNIGYELILIKYYYYNQISHKYH